MVGEHWSLRFVCFTAILQITPREMISLWPRTAHIYYFTVSVGLKSRNCLSGFSAQDPDVSGLGFLLKATWGGICFHVHPSSWQNLFLCTFRSEGPGFLLVGAGGCPQPKRQSVGPQFLALGASQCGCLPPQGSSRASPVSLLARWNLRWCSAITGMTSLHFAIFCLLEASHSSCPHSRGKDNTML